MIEAIKKHNGRLIGLVSIILFFLIWQVLSQFKIIDTLFTGTPLGIIVEGRDLLSSQEFYTNAYSSLTTFMTGFFYAIIVGVFGGLLIGANKYVYKFLKPYIFAINSVPPIVLMPLIIVWFGIGLTAKSTVVFLMAVVPIMVSSIDASRTVDYSLVEMAKSFKANNFFILKSITFFHTLPYIFSAIRVAVGRALIGVIVSEYFGFGVGIGYLISYNSSNFRIDRAMALILMVIIFNIVLVEIINVFEKNTIKWKKIDN